MIEKILNEATKLFSENYKNLINNGQLLKILEKEQTGLQNQINRINFLLLLLNKDEYILEQMAIKAREITKRYFGKQILLYVPLYISNYCISRCTYCGYSFTNKKLVRKKLSGEEIENELIAIKNKGFDSVLILTGDDKKNSPIEFIGNAVEIAKKYFSEVLIEVYALKEEEYKFLIEKGLTGVTIYQETYDKNIYRHHHISGLKKDFHFRLTAPERALKAGVKEINIGCLLGLNKNVHLDVFLTCIHADYLQRKFPNSEISISYPRMQPADSAISPVRIVDDFELVNFIMATRIYLHNIGINLSTREKPFLRDNLIGLGITKMSAGSKTTVGGYFKKADEQGQFEINDKRDLNEIVNVIRAKGYRPEFTNWVKGL